MQFSKFILLFSMFIFSISAITRADDYLLFSVEKGHFEHTKKALKMGAFVNVRDKDGKTPLMFAVNSGKSDIVLLLILYGAGSDFAIRDFDGKTALMYAIENNHTKIIEMLKSHGATE